MTDDFSPTALVAATVDAVAKGINFYKRGLTVPVKIWPLLPRSAADAAIMCAVHSPAFFDDNCFFLQLFTSQHRLGAAVLGRVWCRLLWLVVQKLNRLKGWLPRILLKVVVLGDGPLDRWHVVG